MFTLVNFRSVPLQERETVEVAPNEERNHRKPCILEILKCIELISSQILINKITSKSHPLTSNHHHAIACLPTGLTDHRYTTATRWGSYAMELYIYITPRLGRKSMANPWGKSYNPTNNKPCDFFTVQRCPENHHNLPTIRKCTCFF